MEICHVISIAKPEGNSTGMGSYRPISLLSWFGKVYKKGSNHSLYQYLKSNELLGYRQYGFHRKLSTLDCLMAQQQEWIRLLGNEYDIRQCHSILLELSTEYGIATKATVLSQQQKQQQKAKFYHPPFLSTSMSCIQKKNYLYKPSKVIQHSIL